jgi:hypothetical protein
VRGIRTAIVEGDRLAASTYDRANAGFSTTRELENYRTGIGPILGKITFIIQVTADLKWKYEWEEVRLTASSTSVVTKTNGIAFARAGYAYNVNELANTAVLWAPLGSANNVPTGFKLKPVAVGTPVLLFPIRDTTGKVFWCFDKVNAIDGVCP